MRKKEYVKMEIEKFTIDLSYKISFFLKIPYNCETDI